MRPNLALPHRLSVAAMEALLLWGSLAVLGQLAPLGGSRPFLLPIALLLLTGQFRPVTRPERIALRMAATAGAVLLLGALGLLASADAGLLGALLPSIAFAGGVVTLALRGEALPASDRLWAAANLLGLLGTGATALFAGMVLGAPPGEFATLVRLLPAVLVLLPGAVLWAIRAQMRPVDQLLAGDESARAAAAVRLSSAPWRLALANLVAWVVAGISLGALHLASTGWAAEALQVVAGTVAVGCGVVLFQATWHLRLLAPLRPRVARGIDDAAKTSRLSLGTRLGAALMLVVGCGGTFAVATLSASRVRDQATFASERARLALELARAGSMAESVANEGRFALPQGVVGLPFVLTASRRWSQADIELSPRLLAAARTRPVGVVWLPEEARSAAWASLADGTVVGVRVGWRAEGQAGADGLVALVFVALALAVLGALALTREELALPIRGLVEAARQLGEGQLDTPLPAFAADELGEVGFALERSRGQLRQTLAEVRALTQTLEQRVAERTRQLEAAQAQLVRAETLASVGRLAAGIAHEVNNPLNFVKNALPPLETAVAALPPGEEAEDAQAALRIVRNGTSRMTTTLRALLDFARGPGGAPPEPVEVEPLVQQALELVRPTWAGRIRFEASLPPNLRLKGRPETLGQVLLNLLQNAADATDGEGRVRIGGEQRGEWIALWVEDEGSGMSEAVRQRAFEPFFSTKPTGKGTGLGLAVVHGVLSAVGGRVELESPIRDDAARPGTRVTTLWPAV